MFVWKSPRDIFALTLPRFIRWFSYFSPLIHIYNFFLWCVRVLFQLTTTTVRCGISCCCCCCCYHHYMILPVHIRMFSYVFCHSSLLVSFLFDFSLPFLAFYLWKMESVIIITMFPFGRSINTHGLSLCSVVSVPFQNIWLGFWMPYIVHILSFYLFFWCCKCTRHMNRMCFVRIMKVKWIKGNKTKVG